MYKLSSLNYVTDEPCEKELNCRVADLLEAKRNNLKTVVYLYEIADTSTFRYRVFNMYQSLELSLHWHGTYFYKDELSVVEKYFEYIDLIIIARFRWTFEIDELIYMAKKNDIKVVFEVDDLVYDLKYLPVIVNTLSVNMKEDRSYDYWFAYISRLNAVAKQCDAIITTNQFLAQKMQNDLQKSSYVIQNFTNRYQEEISEFYFKQKQTEYSTGKFVIGYFSGTPSHINDFLTVAPEIRELLEIYSDIQLRIVGFMEMPDSMRKLEEAGRIERKPLVNFLDLQKEIAEVDVNIVPLVNNMFSNSKSELKFFEASIVGTVTCATPSFIFKEVINDKVNGYLCERGKWFNTIADLYNSRKYNENSVVNNSKDYCVKRYSYTNQTKHIENVYDRIVGEV